MPYFSKTGFVTGVVTTWVVANAPVYNWGKQDTQETQDQLTTVSLFNSSVQFNLVLKINNLIVPLLTNEVTTIIVKTSPHNYN